MRRSLVLLVLLSHVVLLSGCLATRGSVREVRGRVDTISRDVAELRRMQDASSRESASVVTELRTLSARFRDTEARIREVSDRVTTLANRVGATESSVRELATAVEKLPVGPVTRVPGPQRPVERGTQGAADQAFAAALRTFHSGELGQAVIEFTDFINRHPKHPLVARAQLWIGEAYFRQRDYRQALVEFQKAVDTAADPSAAADGWLRIGQTYGMLRQRPAANEAWQHLVREYPETDAAGRARMLLRAK